MKLLHISDLHLGKRLGEFRLLTEQAALLEQTREKCRAMEAQADAGSGESEA